MNLWQYLVLLEGTLAAGVAAAGVGESFLGRAPLRFGYTNLGIVLIIAALLGEGIFSRLGQPADVYTVLAGGGFGFYLAGVTGYHAAAYHLRPRSAR